MITIITKFLAKDCDRETIEQNSLRLQKMRQTREHELAAVPEASAGALSQRITTAKRETGTVWKQEKVTAELRQQAVASMVNVDLPKDYTPGGAKQGLSESNNFSYWLRGHAE